MQCNWILENNNPPLASYASALTEENVETALSTLSFALRHKLKRQFRRNSRVERDDSQIESERNISSNTHTQRFNAITPHRNRCNSIAPSLRELLHFCSPCTIRLAVRLQLTLTSCRLTLRNGAMQHSVDNVLSKSLLGCFDETFSRVHRVKCKRANMKKWSLKRQQFRVCPTSLQLK
jgi:hypothetical protein